MTAPPEGSITQLLVLLRERNDPAAAQLWKRFVPRLLGLARQVLASHPRLNSFADDVVQSVFASFFHRVRAGQFVLDDRDDLWNLLAVMTVRKTRRAIRQESAEKRGSGRVISETGLGTLPLEAIAVSRLGPEFDLYAEELLNRLSEELRSVAVLRLMGYTNSEIARQLDWTVRKVERKLQLIRLTWEKDFPEK